MQLSRTRSRWNKYISCKKYTRDAWNEKNMGEIVMRRKRVHIAKRMPSIDWFCIWNEKLRTWHNIFILYILHRGLIIRRLKKSRLNYIKQQRYWIFPFQLDRLQINYHSKHVPWGNKGERNTERLLIEILVNHGSTLARKRISREQAIPSTPADI